MNRKSFARGIAGWALLPMAFLVSASSAPAATVHLWAKPFQKQMPDGTFVNMWGYADSAVAAPSSPGPVITVPVGDSSLTIVLHNELPVATSIVIPGLPATLHPSATGDRITSFTTEAPQGPGSEETYAWSNVRPGTFLYQSGTHPAVQVQMGLYGALVQDAAAGQAYGPASAYAGQQILVYSEVDPALHQAVAPLGGGTGTYGIPPGPTSTLDYKPAHFLVNGEAYTSAQPALAAAAAGQTTLLRFLNAGLKTHVPSLTAEDMRVVAEDGNPYTYPRQQYSVLLPAGKTSDALWTPGTNGTYPVYDRALHLTTGRTAGGMLVKLQVGGGGGPVAVADAFATLEDPAGGLAVAAPGVLGNDTPASGLTAILVTGVNPANGTLALAANGGFTFTPTANFFGAESFTYKANNGSADSNVVTVGLTVTGVNDPPSFTKGANQIVAAGAGAQTVAGWATALSVGPANESGQSLLSFLVTNTNNALFTAQPAVAANGTLTYTPVATLASPAQATVSAQARDNGGTTNGGVDASAIQTFTITVNPAGSGTHVGDLDRGSANVSLFQWQATVTVTVHDQSHNPLAGVTVSRSWSPAGSAGGATTCVTNASGQCSLTRIFSRFTVASATMTLSNLTGVGTYVASANHDPDAAPQNSNGTTITVPRP